MKPKLSILDPNPTPLQYLSGLSQELFREIYIKRDDLTPFGGGGNKLRKLEYLMIEALNSQATTIVTVGAPQTNHGRLTAAVAAKFGLKCIIVAVGDTDGELSGNLLLDGIFGARVVLKHDDGRDHDVQLEETVKKVMAAELKKGEQVYFIPMGGSDTTGMLGYMDCARELDAQAKEEYGFDFDSDFHVETGYIGKGYNEPEPRVREAIYTMARHEGILLDPCYTGKMFAGVLSMIKEKKIKLGRQVILVHTGGMPGLYTKAHRIKFENELKNQIEIVK